MMTKTALSAFLALGTILVSQTQADTVTTTSISTPVAPVAYSTSVELQRPAKPLGGDLVVKTTVTKLTKDQSVVYFFNKDKNQTVVVCFAPQKNTLMKGSSEKGGHMTVIVPPNTKVAIPLDKTVLGHSNVFFMAVYETKEAAKDPKQYDAVWTTDNLAYGQFYDAQYSYSNPFYPTCEFNILEGPLADFPDRQATGVEVNMALPSIKNGNCNVGTVPGALN